jgi:TolA-binding protein
MQKTKFKCVENIQHRRAQSPACQTKSKGFRLGDRGRDEDSLFSQQELFTLIKGLHEKMDQLHGKIESLETRFSELAEAKVVNDELKQWLETQHELTARRDINVEAEPPAESVTYSMSLSDAVLDKVTYKKIKNYDFSSEVELQYKGFKTSGLVAQVEEGFVFTLAPFAEQAKILNEEEEEKFFAGLAEMSKTRPLFFYDQHKEKLQGCAFKLKSEPVIAPDDE